MSSFPPYPEETAALRALLELAEAQLAEVASVRAELAELIEKLGVQRLVSSWNRVQRINDNLQQRVDDARRDLQTVRRVPGDVWIMIFQIWAAEVELECAARDAHDHAALRPLAQVPFIAASVCRYWRDVALDMPALWTTIVLDVGEVDRRPVVWMKFLQCTLIRSRIAPFDLYITIPAAAAAGEESKDIFDTLYTFRDYWRTLDVVAKQYAHPVWSKLVTYSNFPVMQTLSLVRLSRMGDSRPATSIAIVAPQLRLLRLTDVVPVWSHCAEFPELRELYMDDYRHGIDLIELESPETMMPQLEILSLAGIQFDANPRLGARFPRVHTLRYQNGMGIEAYIFPKLRNLDMLGVGDANRLAWLFCKEEVQKSLVVLTVRHEYVDADLADVLGFLGNLEELTLVRCDIFDEFLNALSEPWASSGAWIMPKLQRFRIVQPPTPGLDGTTAGPFWTSACVQDFVDKRKQAAQAGDASAPCALQEVLIEGFADAVQIQL